ncbi:hypothetical protein [Nocardioides alcanivorans]|uniref:hypothetical protein n=1 Tax=Nocardioides alcanivorans TaxID=2897352 RepID=UPI001F23C589|nr:hypothetical protein [Nocardioides alcanivorans]
MDISVSGAPEREWPETTIDEALRKHAAERPDAVAISGLAVEMTWSQLDLAAGRCASIIAETGERVRRSRSSVRTTSAMP